MTLYRVLYLRERKLRGITIAAANAEEANETASRLCRRWADTGDWLSVAPARRPARRPLQMSLSLIARGPDTQ